MQSYHESIRFTSLPTLIIDKSKCYTEYPQIGHGAEGSVHQYNDKLALKLFRTFPYKEKLAKKFAKIEVLGKFHDSAACFPIGLVGYEDGNKEGYYCDIVKPHNTYQSFFDLNFLKDVRTLLNYIIKADTAIQRFHQMGFVLGDIKHKNILIDQAENVRFVDTDNWAYQNWDFDLIPAITFYLTEMYGKDFDPKDVDRFLYAQLVLQYFIPNDIIRFHKCDEYYKRLIKLLNVSPEVKDGLRLIFSDADHKPYIGSVISQINPNEPLIYKESVYKVNRIF